MLFKGSGVALITPFNDDLSINYGKLKELIEFQIKNNSDSIIICGTTGESSTLSFDEFKEIVKFTVNVVNKRIPVIVGTGSNNTETAIKKSKYANDVGADGILVVTPYYNKCNEEGVIKHYTKIADNVDIPIILYNVPSRTGYNLTPEIVLKLSKNKNICGIKEASGNISQVAKLASILPSDFYIYSGNDDQILPVLSLGGKGVISVLANIFPNEVHEMCYSYFTKDLQKAMNLQLKHLELINNLFIETNPIPVKEAMNYLKFNVGGLRLPLSNMSSFNFEILKKSIDKFKKPLNI